MSAHAPAQVGRYVLFKALKKGGMARVYVGFDPERSDRLLAVKTLLADLAKERSFREMFATEGKVGLRLEHPNIVSTVDAGQDRGTAYIAMELISGVDLSTVLRQLRKQGEVLPLPLAVGIARRLVSALAYAHELSDEGGRPLNIVNRDVSPGNVMLAWTGEVKLIDFGIAQTTIDVKSQIGSIKGKISYMSPEQVRGLPVDARTDLFSVGTVLYEMLTGVHVFHDEGDFATMERVRRAEAPPPSVHARAVDAALDAIVARALARDVADRFPSARALLETLDEYIAGRGLQVAEAELAAFLRSMFGTMADTQRAELEAARLAALRGEGLVETRTDEPGPVRPPIFARPSSNVAGPPSRPRSRGRGPLVVAALLVTVGVMAVTLFFLLRGVR